MRERFEGADGCRVVVDAPSEQKMVAGDYQLAEELAGLVDVGDARG